MKKILCLALILSILSCSEDEENHAQKVLNCITYFDVSDMYVYPVWPGTDEWAALNSSEEMMAVSRIPNNVLISISTEGLMESLLTHPLTFTYTAYEELQNGMVALKNENSEAFSTLYAKSDLYAVIVQRYSLMSLDYDYVYPPYTFNDCIGAPASVALLTIEFFMFQDEFLRNKLSSSQRNSIFKQVYNKLLLKIEKEYSEYYELASFAILGKIMHKEGYAPFINACNSEEFLMFFIEYVPYYYPVGFDPFDAILEHAKEYIEGI